LNQSFPTDLAAGEGGYNATWENANASGNYSGFTFGGDDTVITVGSWQNHTETTLRIKPSGQQAAGGTSLYLVLAGGMEILQTNYPDGDIVDGHAPVAPETMQVNGQTLINSGITNDDGTTSGLALITAPSGASVPLTITASAQAYAFTNVQVFKSKEMWQHYVQKEIDADNTGVTIENYQAANGFMNNRTNIQAVYAFYQKLFDEQPTEFYWSGLAKLVGAPVYAGLSDVEELKIQLMGMGTGYLTSLQNQLVQMNIDIYNDLAWQFEAYNKGGLQALNIIYVGETNAFLDSTNIVAWREIDDGISNNIPSEIQAGNALLAYHEQLTILQPDYDTLSSMTGVSILLSALAQNPVPTGIAFTNSVPGGNICVFNDRWKWVTNSVGIWPPWINASPTTQSQWVDIPLLTRATNYVTNPPLIQ
ncbi:MAG: hypothetical protein ACREDS_08650, partial [Limisphaerales bacterium]